jgi:hypothetical protein
VGAGGGQGGERYHRIYEGINLDMVRYILLVCVCGICLCFYAALLFFLYHLVSFTRIHMKNCNNVQ